MKIPWQLLTKYWQILIAVFVISSCCSMYLVPRKRPKTVNSKYKVLEGKASRSDAVLILRKIKKMISFEVAKQDQFFPFDFRSVSSKSVSCYFQTKILFVSDRILALIRTTLFTILSIGMLSLKLFAMCKQTELQVSSFNQISQKNFYALWDAIMIHQE